MNDNRFEEVMQSYKKSLGNSSRRNVSPKRPPVFRLAVSGGIAAIALTACLVLWPKDAGAAALARMTRAIRKVKTMEISYQRAVKDGWHEFDHISYKEGKWRFDIVQGGVRKSARVLSGGRLLTEFQDLDHATLESTTAEAVANYVGEGEEISALDFAKLLVDSGETSTERVASVIPGPDSASYTLRLERASDDYRADILVSKETDLPISAEISVTYRASDTTHQRFRQTYSFEKELADSLFDIKSSKPIVNLSIEQLELSKHWNVPLATCEGTDVRDARVTQNGAIWIAVTPTSAEKLVLPSSIDAGNGVSYARTMEIVPSSILGKPQTFAMDKKFLYIVAFTPLTRTAELPGRVTVKMSRRKPIVPGFSEEGDNVEEEMADSTELLLQNELKPLPFYFPALDLDEFGFQVPVVLGNTKARAFEKDQRWAEAGRAYEECAAAYAGYVKRGAQFPLKDAVRCYRKAGMTAEADRAEAEITRVKSL